ncbi:Rrf2 family transcriptional regulator [Novosphingobium sp. FSY-8]|uniref:Rrf2 family transcriptional regulator n=1 Tax=Novosphingobium ovatum TaxID=1908523 RepID=A0ABW9X9A1_9SPHN|nr:Rrf2 family transcriptional regulator [Novosphingobium ovatum]NBC35116.1 Rrf2 family transcriptional regulator [Novosphingobium ovatum]
MAHITASVEYGIHCLLWLVGNDGRPVSSRDLAELQGVSPSFIAKIFPKLEKAGILKASEGVRGGYLLARPAQDISFLDIVDAIEGDKPLFECQEVRERCALFTAGAPDWATHGPCAVHAVMMQAEQAMRAALAAQTLADVGARFHQKAPAAFLAEANDWIGQRLADRTLRTGRRSRDDPG